MAGSVTVTRIPTKAKANGKVIEKIRVDWVGDVADGSVPLTTISSMSGYIFKVITAPGSPAPTASYNVKLWDKDIGGSLLSVLQGKVDGRSSSAVEEVYTQATGATAPLVVAGDYDFQITANSALSAKGTVIFYVQETF